MTQEFAISPTARLGDLEFVDLYLGTDFADFKGLKGSPNTRDPAPPHMRPQLIQLHAKCRMICLKERDPEFSILEDGVMFRATMMREVSGGEVFSLRRFSAELRPIEQVGMAPVVVKKLLSPDVRGLVVIAGETGAGKTTTAAAILKARLERLGGIALTIEDPPEVNLSGEQGKGRCMQVRASRRTGGYKEHLVRALRSNPDVILLGEVREEAAASEVVEASLNGHMIITTVHAGSIVEAVERLASLAGGQRGSEGSYKKLSSGLKAVIWQSLERTPTGKYQYKYDALFLSGDEAVGARSKIANGKIAHLVQDIDQQMRRIRVNPVGA